MYRSWWLAATVQPLSRGGREGREADDYLPFRIVCEQRRQSIYTETCVIWINIHIPPQVSMSIGEMQLFLWNANRLQAGWVHYKCIYRYLIVNVFGHSCAQKSPSPITKRGLTNYQLFVTAGDLSLQQFTTSICEVLLSVNPTNRAPPLTQDFF